MEATPVTGGSACKMNCVPGIYNLFYPEHIFLKGRHAPIL